MLTGSHEHACNQCENQISGFNFSVTLVSFEFDKKVPTKGRPVYNFSQLFSALQVVTRIVSLSNTCLLSTVGSLITKNILIWHVKLKTKYLDVKYVCDHNVTYVFCRAE